MIYMLRSLYDLMCASFTGSWWFNQQQPLNIEPVPPEVTDSADEATDDVDYIDVDDGSPLPPLTGHDKPICVSCGDPNFSLEGDVCIACRVGMR